MSSPVVLSKSLIPASLVSLAALAVPALVWAASALPFPFSVLASLLAMGAAYLTGKPIRPPRFLAGRVVLPAVLVPLAGTLSAALFSLSLTLSGWHALAAMAGAVVLAALAGLSEPAPLLNAPVVAMGVRYSADGKPMGLNSAVDLREHEALTEKALAGNLSPSEAVRFKASTDALLGPTASADGDCSLGEAGQGKCK